jgi:O-acetyl-ADP-ribose deacetylase (regulator of RNase III)
VIAFSIPPLTVEIVDGDISSETTDAIVNAANNAFWMGAGVAGAIKARGGETIEREAVAQGGVALGECVLTSGGRLAARHVIHAAVMGPDLRTSANVITLATRNALVMAERQTFRSCSLPAFGTGVGGFPLDLCARLMITTIRDLAPSFRSLQSLRLVLFGQAAYQAFADAGRTLLDPAAAQDSQDPHHKANG